MSPDFVKLWQTENKIIELWQSGKKKIIEIREKEINYESPGSKHSPPPLDFKWKPIIPKITLTF